MNGIFNVLKPPGITSSQVVGRMRRILGEKRVGHAGTLDPQAAGVLVVCAGRATRLIPYLRQGKEYIAELTLGTSTDTLDAWGRALERRPAAGIGESHVRAALEAFRGDIMQIPPMYSALKRQGKPLYQLARRGEEVCRQARPVRIDELELIRQSGQGRYMLRVACSAGTYIRTLCDDIGGALGCGGHMSFLVRTGANGLCLGGAHTLEALEEGGAAGASVALGEALGHIPALNGEPAWAKPLRNGAKLACEAQGGIYRVYVNGAFMGLGAAQKGALSMALQWSGDDC